MLIEILLATGISLPSLTIGVLISRRIWDNPVHSILWQAIVSGSIAASVWSLFPSLSIALVYISIGLPVTANAVSIGRNYWYKRRALSGAYGKSTQWAAELVNEGDREFEMAATSLPDEERLELGIVAESKEELRELVLRRHEASDREPIPEDFVK